MVGACEVHVGTAAPGCPDSNFGSDLTDFALAHPR